MNYEMIKKNYEHGLWTANMVKMASVKGIITKEEAEKIISENKK